jgi:hypothetical protein
MNNDNCYTNAKRTMPVCLSTDDFKLLERYAKKKGMTNCSQAIEYLATEK